MKKTILLAVLVMFGIASYAQDNKTTDDTIRYLLERIENLEHQFSFNQDFTDLQIMDLNISRQYDAISLNAIPRSKVKEYLESVERNYNAKIRLITLHDLKYNYTEEERECIKSAKYTISLLISAIRDWLY